MKTKTIARDRGAVRLTLSQVERLATLLVSDVDDPKARLEIEVGYDGTQIEANTYAELQTHVDDFPDNLVELKMSLYMNKGRHINLQMYHNFARLYVTGIEEPWVLGKYAQIDTFLKRHRPWFINPGLPGTLFMYGTMTLIASLSVLISHHEWSIAAAALVLSVLLAVAAFGTITGRLFPHVQIIVRKRRRIDRDLVVAVATILTLVATVWIAVEPYLPKSQ